jgi:hypothetical protein
MKEPATRARSGSGVTVVPRIRGRSRRLSPLSWARIISEVRTVVARSPNNAHPAQFTSAVREGVCLRLQRGEDLGEGCLEGLDALVLESVADLVHVDACAHERVRDRLGL